MVKCADCGYLAQLIYRGSVPQGFIDIEEIPRQTGELPGNSLSFGDFIPFGQPDLRPEKMRGDNCPTCFMRAAQLNNETVARYAEIKASNDGTLASAVKDIIHKDRVCKRFMKWERGFTPKEHREMAVRERERIWHIVEVIAIGLFTIGAGVIGALIARGKI